MNNYNKPFRITENIGNNVFCFDEIPNPKIYIPKLIKGNISDIKIGENTAFREKKKGKIIKYKGLQNFVQLSSGVKSNNIKNIYIFDNHNHALYFRYKEYFEGNIKKKVNLIHIDQHTDMNKNDFIISDNTKQSPNIKNIFQFTNEKCNVGNFIQPAIKEGLLGNIEQITTEYKLLNFDTSYYSKGNEISNNHILDIDLDFRDPNMSISQFQKTITITKELIKKSRVVTIATSPYFLNQEYAIELLNKIL